MFTLIIIAVLVFVASKLNEKTATGSGLPSSTGTGSSTYSGSGSGTTTPTSSSSGLPSSTGSGLNSAMLQLMSGWGGTVTEAGSGSSMPPGYSYSIAPYPDAPNQFMYSYTGPSRPTWIPNNLSGYSWQPIFGGAAPPFGYIQKNTLYIWSNKPIMFG